MDANKCSIIVLLLLDVVEDVEQIYKLYWKRAKRLKKFLNETKNVNWKSRQWEKVWTRSHWNHVECSFFLSLLGLHLLSLLFFYNVCRSEWVWSLVGLGSCVWMNARLREHFFIYIFFVCVSEKKNASWYSFCFRAGVVCRFVHAYNSIQFKFGN